jgi:hypothetical protein
MVASVKRCETYWIGGLLTRTILVKATTNRGARIGSDERDWRLATRQRNHTPDRVCASQVPT